MTIKKGLLDITQAKKDLKKDFSCDDDYNDAVNIGAFMWAAKMIIDLKKHLETSIIEKDTNKLASLANLSPKIVSLIRQCKRHSMYIKNPIKGHPYKLLLSENNRSDKEIISDGALCRELVSLNTGDKTNGGDSSLRSLILSQMPGIKQKVIKTVESSKTTYEEINSNEW